MEMNLDLQTADLDGDGDMDVLAGSSIKNEIAWYENNGANPPAFAAHKIADASGVHSVKAADINHDGQLDVTACNWKTSEVDWYENNGTTPPGFVKHTIASGLVTWPYSVSVADMNHDGFLDILAAICVEDPGGGNVILYKNNGATSPEFSSHIVASRIQPKNVLAADLNRDSHLDILLANYDGSSVAWYQSDGAATPGFTPYTITGHYTSPSSFCAADLDNDGRMDIISACGGFSGSIDTNGEIIWHRNIGNSPLFPDYRITESSPGVIAIDAADLNQDGRPDILAANMQTGDFAWYESGGGPAPAFPMRTIGNLPGNAYSVKGVDMNGDGRMDVLAGGSMEVAWFESDGAVPPSFVKHTVKLYQEKPINPTSLHGIDMDRDGDQDVLASCNGSNSMVVWYENNGMSPPEFTERILCRYPQISYPKFSYAADLDGDGDQDVLAMGNNFLDKLVWLENVGGSPPNFTYHLIAEIQDPRSIFPGDFNGDGRMDFVATFRDSSEDLYRIPLYENNGNKSSLFTRRNIPTPACGKYGLLGADLDGNRTMDLVWYTLASGGANIVWHKNLTEPPRNRVFNWRRYQ